MSALTFVLEEEDMRRALVGTPLYVHTMIAFASVFLMKVATIKSQNTALGPHFSFDPPSVWSVLERMIDLLKNTITSTRHLLYHVAAGIEKMLRRARQGTNEWSSGLFKGDGVAQQPEANGRESPQAITQCHQRMTSSEYHDWQPPNDQWPNTNNVVLEDTGQQFMANNELPHNQMMYMHDSVFLDAFGNEAANDVYSLLSSQFSH